MSKLKIKLTKEELRENLEDIKEELVEISLNIDGFNKNFDLWRNFLSVKFGIEQQKNNVIFSFSTNKRAREFFNKIIGTKL